MTECGCSKEHEEKKKNWVIKLLEYFNQGKKTKSNCCGVTIEEK